MTTTTKKDSQSVKAKRRRAAVKSSPAKQAQTIAELRQELAESLKRENATAKELREALEHQTATAEVLGIISRSPTDVQPVLDAIVESAAHVCGIDDVALRLREGNNLVLRAHFGPIPAGRVAVSVDSPASRWMREHGTLHVRDVQRAEGFSDRKLSSDSAHSFLFVPLRQKRGIHRRTEARRSEVRPFTPAQIKLLETFAEQAVIAIENVRLFQELKESLEQQTASSEILGVIASSPTDIQPVLDCCCGKRCPSLWTLSNAQIWRIEGHMVRKVANYGSSHRCYPSAKQGRFRPGSLSGRAILDQQPVHVDDMLVEREEDYADVWHSLRVWAFGPGWPFLLFVKVTPIGAITNPSAPRCAPSQRRSNCLKPSPTRP